VRTIISVGHVETSCFAYATVTTTMLFVLQSMSLTDTKHLKYCSYLFHVFITILLLVSHLLYLFEQFHLILLFLVEFNNRSICSIVLK
jgi:hypothetical protein